MRACDSLTRIGSRLRRRDRDESGAIAVMAAVLVLALVLSASLAVDVGQVAAASRDFQGATDRAALDGVQTLQVAHAAGAALDGALLDTVEKRVEDSLLANGFPPERLEEEVEVVIGHVAAGSTCFVPLLPAGAHNCDVGAAGLDPNAVQVHGVSYQSFVLALGDDEGGRIIPKTAVAASDMIGAVSAASTTASLENGFVTALLTELTGSDVSLNLVGYRGLVDTQISLRGLAGELGVGTVDEIADVTLDVVGPSEPEAPTLIGAIINVLNADGGIVGADVTTFLGELNTSASGLGEIALGEILEIATGSGSAADVDVDGFSLVTAALQLANRDNWLDLGAEVDGVTDANLRIIQPPVIAVGPARMLASPAQSADDWATVARTAQVELDLTIGLDLLEDLPLVGGLLDTLIDDLLGGLLGGLLGCGGFLKPCPDDPQLGDLKVGLTTGRGASALTTGYVHEDMSYQTHCVGDGRVTTLTESASAELDISTPGGLVSYDGSSLDLAVGLDLSQSDAMDSHFDGPFPSEVQTLPQETTPSVGLDLSENFSGGLVGQLTSSLVEDVEGLLNELLLEDDGVVTSLLSTLGVKLGSVEVQALSVDCDGRRLLPLSTDRESSSDS